MEERMNTGSAPAWAVKELDRVCAVLEKEMERYGTKFPSACAEGGVYSVGENDDWTNGFWTAMLWMAYQYTGRRSSGRLPEENVKALRKGLRIISSLNIMTSDSCTACPSGRDTGLPGMSI